MATAGADGPVVGFLSMLGRAMAAAHAMSRAVAARAGVVECRVTLGCGAYSPNIEQSITVLEVLVDAELADGRAPVWRLTMGWDGTGWIVEYDVAVTTKGDWHIVQEWPLRRTSGIAALEGEVMQAQDDLLASLDSDAVRNETFFGPPD